MKEFYDRKPDTCRYCGESFEDSPDGRDAETKELIHRSKNHVIEDKKLPQKGHSDDKKTSVVETYEA